MIDSHCHLDVARFDSDRPAVLERAWAAGLTGIVVPAIGPSDWQVVAAYPSLDKRVQFGLGVHPQFLPELDPAEDDARLEQLDALLSTGVAIAVGECGLDGPSATRGPFDASMERQVRVLRGHLDLARKYELPVLMHCLRAHPALRDLMKTEKLPRVLMHSYSGGAELSKYYLQAGCYFSFAGPVTFAEARKPLDAVRSIPVERLLAETDAPDQAPHPHRGSRSEPAYLPLIIEGLARAHGRPVAELIESTTANAQTLFPRAHF